MKPNKFMFVKGALLLFIVTLLSLVKVEDVKAETILSGGTIEINDANSAEDIDWDSIMSALSDQQIVDGTSITVGDDYRLECEVIMEPVTNSSLTDLQGADSSLSSESTTSSYSTNYIATCNVYIYISGISTHAATLTHSILVTYYPGNLVHISSGSLSVSTYSNFTGTAYGYTIVNTDGTYSYAYGMVEIYCISNQLYYYYGSTASVTPGSTPSFSFSQV